MPIELNLISISNFEIIINRSDIYYLCDKMKLIDTPTVGQVVWNDAYADI